MASAIETLLGISQQNKKKKDQQQPAAAPATVPVVSPFSLQPQPGRPATGVIANLSTIAQRNQQNAPAKAAPTPLQGAQATTKSLVSLKPEDFISKFNTAGVYDQRTMRNQLQAVADNKDFKSKDDIVQSQLAKNYISLLDNGGEGTTQSLAPVVKKAGNPITLLQDIVTGTAQTLNKIPATIVDSASEGVRRDAINTIIKKNPTLDPASGYTQGAINSAFGNTTQNTAGSKTITDPKTGAPKTVSKSLPEFAGKSLGEGADVGLTIAAPESGSQLINVARKQLVNEGVELTQRALAARTAKLLGISTGVQTGAATASDAVNGREVSPTTILENAGLALGGTAAGIGPRGLKVASGATNEAVVAAQDARHAAATQATGVTRQQFDAFRNGNPNAGITPQQFDNYRTVLQKNEAGFVSLGGVAENPADDAVAKVTQPAKITSVNPTGTVFTDYNPQSRANAPTADNITTIDKTTGGKPDDQVTLYRGAPASQKAINPGDFVTTNKQLAQDYAGNGKVISMQAPKSHVLDDLSEPGAEEYIYRPEPANPVAPAAPEKQFHDQYVDEQVASHKSAQQYADELADGVWNENKKGQGVDFINNDLGAGETDTRRVSNNSPFYRDFYAQYGTKPTRKAIKDMVDQLVLGKRGEYDANILRRSMGDDEARVHEDVGARLADREATPRETTERTDPVTAFNNSKNQTPLPGGRDANFEIGDFGRNSLARKSAKGDRLTEQEIAETVPHVDRAYNASDNPESYRSGNTAHVATMPDGEKRVIYTRRNARGADEVINAHSIKNVPNYEDRLKSYGTPDRSRTGNPGLEIPDKGPLNGGVRGDARTTISQKAPKAEARRVRTSESERQASPKTTTEPAATRQQSGAGDRETVSSKLARKQEETPLRQQSRGEVPKVGEDIPSGSSIPDKADAVKEAGRTGEKYAKPQSGFVRSKGRVQQNGGVILRESESGNQRQILHTNNLGERMLVTETKQPDGTWSSRKNQDPAIEYPDDYTQIDNVEKNRTLQDAVKSTAESGDELHFYAAKNVGDPNARAAEVVRIDPSNYIIDGGFVRDPKTNAILGNHIVVDPSGMAINIGKQIVNMDSLVGNTTKWKDLNHGSWTMDRIIEAAAPTREAYDKMHTFLIKDKNAHEAKMRVDLKDYRDTLVDKRRELLRSKPAGLPKSEFFTDVFHYAEKKLAPTEATAGKMLDQDGLLEAKYGRPTASKIRAFDKWARSEYDSLLDRTNETLREFGHDEVPKRQNYMTHLQEDSLWDKIGIGEDLWRDLSSGISGESNPSNRGKLPGTIVGKTEEFKPTKKYNPFHQTRRGNDSMTDPFKAMDAYGEAALFNIHMTEPAVRARSVESAFRVAEEVTNADLIKSVSKDLRGAIKERYGGNKSDLISAFQEYANALAGKSSSIDRIVQDKLGGTGRTALRMSRLLQKVASQSTIVGNVSVTLSQALNAPNVIGTNGIRNFIKGIGHTIGDGGFVRDGLSDPNAPISKSNFMRTRYTDANSRINESRLHKLNEGVSKALLMKQAEKAFAEIAWNSSYARATAGKAALKGQAAINEADRLTERLIAGRGIGDQPEIYRSTIGRTFLQYTLEVNAAFKNVTKDMSPVGLIKYAVAVYALNLGIEQITGRKPLPDFLGVGIDTAADFLNSNDDPEDTPLDNTVQAAQRGLNAVASSSPIMSAGANIFLSQDLRKKIFGEDSNLGRFDGSVAAAGVVGNLITAFSDLAQGKYEQAGKDAASVLPYGGQIKKTYEGISTMMGGVAQNSNGTPIAAVDTSNPVNWIKAALFGKNAIPEVKAYYDGKNSPLSKSQVDEYNDIKNKKGDAAAQKFVDETYQDKVDRLKEKQADAKKEADKKSGGLEGSASAATVDIAGQVKDMKKADKEKQKAFKDSFSDDDYALYTLDKAGRKEAIAKGLATQTKFDQLDAYAKQSKQKQGIETKDATPASKVLAPDSSEYKFLDDQRQVKTEDKKDWNRKQVDPKYQGMIDDINKAVPDGMPKVPATNAVAALYAKFVEDKTAGNWSELELNKKTEDLVKSSYKTELTDNQQFINGLSDNEILDAVDKGQISKDDLDKVMQLDGALKTLGFSQNFGNSLRKKLGYDTLATSSKSGSGTGSTRTKGTTKTGGFKFPSARFNRVKHTSATYKLLSSAGRGIK